MCISTKTQKQTNKSIQPPENVQHISTYRDIRLDLVICVMVDNMYIVLNCVICINIVHSKDGVIYQGWYDVINYVIYAYIIDGIICRDANR